MIQLCLGLWWNTINFTLRLIDDKVVVYDKYLRDMASRSAVSLRDMQRIAGWEQRVEHVDAGVQGLARK